MCLAQLRIFDGIPKLPFVLRTWVKRRKRKHTTTDFKTQIILCSIFKRGVGIIFSTRRPKNTHHDFFCIFFPAEEKLLTWKNLAQGTNCKLKTLSSAADIIKIDCFNGHWIKNISPSFYGVNCHIPAFKYTPLVIKFRPWPWLAPFGNKHPFPRLSGAPCAFPK